MFQATGDTTGAGRDKGYRRQAAEALVAEILRSGVFVSMEDKHFGSSARPNVIVHATSGELFLVAPAGGAKGAADGNEVDNNGQHVDGRTIEADISVVQSKDVLLVRDFVEDGIRAKSIGARMLPVRRPPDFESAGEQELELTERLAAESCFVSSRDGWFTRSNLMDASAAPRVNDFKWGTDDWRECNNEEQQRCFRLCRLDSILREHLARWQPARPQINTIELYISSCTHEEEILMNAGSGVLGLAQRVTTAVLCGKHAPRWSDEQLVDLIEQDPRPVPTLNTTWEEKLAWLLRNPVEDDGEQEVLPKVALSRSYSETLFEFMSSHGFFLHTARLSWVHVQHPNTKYEADCFRVRWEKRPSSSSSRVTLPLRRGNVTRDEDDSEDDREQRSPQKRPVETIFREMVEDFVTTEAALARDAEIIKTDIEVEADNLGGTRRSLEEFMFLSEGTSRGTKSFREDEPGRVTETRSAAQALADTARHRRYFENKAEDAMSMSWYMHRMWHFRRVFWKLRRFMS